MKALFLTIIIILAIAGGVVVWYGDQHKDTAWQKTLEQISGMWGKASDKQKPPEQTKPSAGPFPFAERIVDPKTGWILFSQPEYVPISFLYPPEFEQTGAHRFEWGGVVTTFSSRSYLIRITVGGEGKGLPPEMEYGTAMFDLGSHVFQFTLSEEDGIVPSSWRGLPVNQRNELAEILNLTPGLNILMVEAWCSLSDAKDCIQSKGRRLLHDVASSIRLASDPR